MRDRYVCVLPLTRIEQPIIRIGFGSRLHSLEAIYHAVTALIRPS